MYTQHRPVVGHTKAPLLIHHNQPKPSFPPPPPQRCAYTAANEAVKWCRQQHCVDDPLEEE
eukprot:NODE_7760_length_308_cov_23.787645_g7022_i0.p2 GENE.NODE_7760_length_308_cov_23.787645_g7022_i0~~NODE_7760_length_308_cov_23.787645_g7022_i0.p2  ORF type:complete len:61 (-),score=16.72 NODE_7760_length_308_cov_23.787645_g7022_i0:84-266(-)